MEEKRVNGRGKRWQRGEGIERKEEMRRIQTTVVQCVGSVV